MISLSTASSSGHSKLGAVDIEGVPLSSGFEEEELSGGSVIFGEIDGDGGDIFGDVRADSNLLRDVPVDESVSVRGLVGIVV